MTCFVKRFAQGLYAGTKLLLYSFRLFSYVLPGFQVGAALDDRGQQMYYCVNCDGRIDIRMPLPINLRFGGEQHGLEKTSDHLSALRIIQALVHFDDPFSSTRYEPNNIVE
jgi:hypothetical protein